MQNARAFQHVSAENSARYECCRFAMPLVVLLRTRTCCCGVIAGSDALRAFACVYSDMLWSSTLSLYICALCTLATTTTTARASTTPTRAAATLIYDTTFAYSPRTSSVSSLSDRTSETPTYSASSSGFSVSRRRNRCLTWRPRGPGSRRLSSRLLPFF